MKVSDTVPLRIVMALNSSRSRERTHWSRICQIIWRDVAPCSLKLKWCLPFRSIGMLTVILVHFWMLCISEVMLMHQSDGVGMRSGRLQNGSAEDLLWYVLDQCFVYIIINIPKLKHLLPLLFVNDGTYVLRSNGKRGSVLQDDSGEPHSICEARV